MTRVFTTSIMLVVFLLEALILAGVTLRIPSDPQNAVFMGYTTGRLVILAGFLFVLIAIVVALAFIKRVDPVLQRFFDSPHFVSAQSWVLLVFGVALWFVIWLPATRFPELQEEVIRLRPLVLTVLLILFELVVFYRIILRWKKIWLGMTLDKSTRNTLLWSMFSFLIILGFFLFLRITSTNKLSSTLLFSTGPFIAPLQALFGLLIFLVIYLFSVPERQNHLSKPVLLGLLALIFLSTFAVWYFSPFTCVDDRPGPFPPNNVCYPQVDDSVYSIGSHYITLGRGVLNHWFTDKPFYMVFLAIGQWIFGINIDNYLIFQIAILSVLPVFLFLLARKFSGLAGGILAASLAIMLGANNIRYYAIAGGVNVKIENTEALTSILLVICAFFLVKFLTKKQKGYLLLLSGGMLGLSSLTRVNPVFILPLLIILFLILNWKRWRRFFTTASIFLLGFLVVFTPGLLSSRDKDGNFYYIQKIEKVLDVRYQGGQTHLLDRENVAKTKFAPTDFSSHSGSVKQVAYQTESQIALSTKQIGNRHFVSIDELSKSKNKSNLISRLRIFVLTTTNNLYLSLARLSVNLSLHSIPQTIKLPGSITSQRIPMWQMQFSAENWIVLILNLLLVVYGCFYSYSRWRGAALVPLFMFLGYHLGNGAALTSGERYLEPVQWVVLIYFAVGVFGVTQLVLRKMKPAVQASTSEFQDEQKIRIVKGSASQGWISLGILLILGALLPLTNLLPNKINARRPDVLRNEILSVAPRVITAENLDRFLESDKAVIVEGIAYHPRVYNSPIMKINADEFELTVLGEKKTYVSNYFGNEPVGYFTNGSRVILLGCKIREKTFWGVETVILNTKAIVQLDHEKSRYFVTPELFYCRDN